LIDLNPQGLSIVIACAPEVWQDIVSEYHAFAERIYASATLRPLSKKHLIRFVKSYLESCRVDRRRGTAPFKDQALKNIAELSGGNVRRVVTLCNEALRTAAERGLNEVDASCIPRN
jgi:type II secretory pathway predicted ATPase ExeA